MKIYSNPVRGVYRRSESGSWVLQPASTNRRPYRDQHLLPPTFRFDAGSILPEHPAYPTRVRLGAGPLDVLGIAHIVHVLQGEPRYGTLYAFHRGEEVVLQLEPTGVDKSNPSHIGQAFFDILQEVDERAAAHLRGRSYTSSVPLSDDLPALYASFAR